MASAPIRSLYCWNIFIGLGNLCFQDDEAYSVSEANGTPRHRLLSSLGLQMIALKAYFCPRCGCGYESSECKRTGRFFQIGLRCPECDVPVGISGWSFIIIGLLIWFLSAFVLDTTTPFSGAILGAVLGLFGLFRLIRQALARRSAQPAKESNS